MKRKWNIQFTIEAPGDMSDFDVEGIVSSGLKEVGFTFDGEEFIDAEDITAELFK